MSENNRLLAWIIAGVFVWGTLHAVGAYTFNHQPARFLMVIGCVNVFLAFWLFLLWCRRRRQRTRALSTEEQRSNEEAAF